MQPFVATGKYRLSGLNTRLDRTCNGAHTFVRRGGAFGRFELPGLVYLRAETNPLNIADVNAKDAVDARIG